MEFDPDIARYYTSEESSFAYASARVRWPIILGGGIADISETINICDDPQSKEEGESIIDGLQKLRTEIQSDAKLPPIPNDGFNDITGYNDELAQRNPTWMNVFWLYGECYVYRRINTFFTLSKRWKDYDIFARQKMSAFRSSKWAILELAARYKTVHDDLTVQDSLPEMLLFKEMCEVCLWGNATDLSLLTSLTYEDLQKLQGTEARKRQEKNVLINDVLAAFDVLKDARQGQAEVRVDIVLDNAGFELFVDLLLAGFLLSTGLATHVVFHPKSIPWFVSDALPADFTGLLSALSDPMKFFSMTSNENNLPPPDSLSTDEIEDLLFVSSKLNRFQQSGALIIRQDQFWTTGGSYWRLPHMAPDLFNELRKSDLVLFKGDLNYRKLTGDARWESTTPFADAIGPLGKGSGMRTLALRTCKSDVVVGLCGGEDERLRSRDQDGNGTGARQWTWTGKWAVVSFCDGKTG